MNCFTKLFLCTLYINSRLHRELELSFAKAYNEVLGLICRLRLEPKKYWGKKIKENVFLMLDLIMLDLIMENIKKNQI